MMQKTSTIALALVLSVVLATGPVSSFKRNVTVSTKPEDNEQQEKDSPQPPANDVDKPKTPDASAVPGDNAAAPAPATSLTIDIDAAFLYTKGYDGGDEYEVISADNATIEKSNFQAGAKTYIIIHGFVSRASVSWIIDLKDKILERDPGSNVVAVEWTTSAGTNFTYATYNKTLPYIQPLGESVSHLLGALHLVKHLDYEKVHIIGLNLGAHIAGFAGKATPSPLGRITGLDPANKGYLKSAQTNRLDKNDANYVDIIHTNSCNNWNVWSDCFGIYQSIGHTDFWPNGGAFQPACEDRKSTGLRCDHTIVTDYFVESFAYSITDTRFLARPAKNYHAYCAGKVSCGAVPQYMGILADSNAIYGRYYLNTSKKAPYALEDWRCPTEFRKGLYQTSCVAASAVLCTLVVIAATYFFLGIKHAYSKQVASITRRRSLYSRFYGNDDYSSDNDRINQPPVFRVDCRSPMRRFYEDLLSRSQTPMSIPESMDTYSTASEMNVRSDNARTDRRDGSKSVEELVKHQINLRRGFDDLRRNRLDEDAPALQSDQAQRRTDQNPLCAESLCSSDAALPFDASMLAFNDTASQEGSIDLWLEFETR